MISGSDWRPSDAVTRRRTLFDISPLMHCSIIGTCLTTAELRKIVNRIIDDRDSPTISDHQIHREGVHYASVPGVPTKLLNKALEQRHIAVIRKFNEHKTEGELREAWERAKREGAVEGAYWAILTHPAATEKLANAVFGDVHMLSHLVGATSRADIKRLAKLEAETAVLTAQI